MEESALLLQPSNLQHYLFQLLLCADGWERRLVFPVLGARGCLLRGLPLRLLRGLTETLGFACLSTERGGFFLVA